MTEETKAPEYMAKSGERKAHPFLMYDNIINTPTLLKECLEGSTYTQTETMAKALHERGARRLIFTGCGTSLFVGKQLVLALAQMAGMPGLAENPFELKHYPPVELDADAALVVISHSGVTKADRQAIELARQHGAFVCSFTDNPEAPIIGMSDTTIVGPGGRDAAIPKTRSYTTSYYRGLVLVALLAQLRGRTAPIDEIKALPALAEQVVRETEAAVRELATAWSEVDKYFGVGAGPNAWTGVEAALKMMETTGLVGQGFELEEYTHGPELSLDERSAAIFFQADEATVERAQTAAAATAAAGAKVAVVTSLTGAKWVEGATVIRVPQVPVLLSPTLMMLPAQMLVYYTALRLGRRPDVAGTDNPKIRAAIQVLHPPGSH